MALVYNWWNLFTRLTEPEQHLEVGPILLSDIDDILAAIERSCRRTLDVHATIA